MRAVDLVFPDYKDPQIPGIPEANGVAPYEVVVAIYITKKANDYSSTRNGNKVEIDFGDGSGWQDITERALEFNNTVWPATGDAHERTYIHHTYEEPGSYEIFCRVYWPDGFVARSELLGNFVFNIISEEEADEAFAEGGD